MFDFMELRGFFIKQILIDRPLNTNISSVLQTAARFQGTLQCTVE